MALAARVETIKTAVETCSHVCLMDGLLDTSGSLWRKHISIRGTFVHRILRTELEDLIPLSEAASLVPGRKQNNE